MPSTTIYTIEALSTGGGRDGHVHTTDDNFDADMRAPKSLGGSGTGLNPEQLFAAGYAACFHSALHGAARSMRKTITGSTVGARVSLVKSDDGVDLAVTLEVVIPHQTLELAREITRVAHEHCPYSRATRGNIDITVTVVED